MFIYTSLVGNILSCQREKSSALSKIWDQRSLAGMGIWPCDETQIKAQGSTPQASTWA